MNSQYVIVVAGGTGSRMKSLVPKQFMELARKPILMRSIEAFYRYSQDIKIIVVLPVEQKSFWQELCRKHRFQIPHLLVEGGETRYHSVRNGLREIPDNGLVAIHDGVRPLVSQETIDGCFREAALHGNAIPCLPVYESVRQINPHGNSMVDRATLRMVQTPQVFSCSLIKEAYLQSPNAEFTDDASVLEGMGYSIHLTDGNRENINITDPFDLAFAEHLFSLTIVR